MTSRALLTASLLAAATSAAAEYIPGSNFGYGNWTGSAYTFDETGKFSHCGISAPYKSGDTLHFAVHGNASVSIGVQSTSGMFQPGTTIPVTLRIDRRQPYHGTANALTHDFAALTIQDFEGAMNAFRKGRLLVIESSVGTGVYDLSGTSRALNATMECAYQYLNYVGQPKQGNEAAAISASTIDQSTLYQVATGMITDMGISDFRYLTKAETEKLFPSNAVMWSSDSAGLLGGVVAATSEGLSSLKDTDAQDWAYMSQSCDGEVATTARSINNPGYASRELRSLCVTGSETVESLMTKTLIGPTVIYTFLVFQSDSKVSEPAKRQTMSENAAVRAASFVVNNKGN